MKLIKLYIFQLLGCKLFELKYRTINQLTIIFDLTTRSQFIALLEVYREIELIGEENRIVWGAKGLRN